MYEDNDALQEIIQDQAQEIENLESLMGDDDEEEMCDCPMCRFIRMLDEQGIKVI